ncbi:MAG: ABC transporter permease subunit [Actinophytocola sp.]|nr:ABC transporter permease subunit [Actinophytocola sp.]
MGRYTLRRLLQLIPVLIGTTFIIHFLVWQLPADPFDGRCGQRPCSEAFIARMNEQFHLDEPFYVQYFIFLGKMLTGDFGVSFNQVPVINLIEDAYPNTLKLALVALTIEAVIGVGAGVMTGLKRGGFLDNLVLVSSLFLMALPIVVVAFFMKYLFWAQLGWIEPNVSTEVRWSELIVPGFVLATTSMAFIARLMRANIAENSSADFVKTAKAKGLGSGRVVGVHLLRNSLIPVVTFIGLDLGNLMAGAIVTEGIFNINGVGLTIFRALSLQDATIVVPLATMLVLVYLFMNLLVDLLYGLLDPRIRYE